MQVYRWRGPRAARQGSGRHSNSCDPIGAGGSGATAALTPPVPSETYIGVQILRGLAAFLIVVFHAGLMVQDRFPGSGDHWTLRFGAAGVDIFFPISGFVMLLSTRALVGRSDGWLTFIRRRIIRIVPLYWLATTAKLLAVLTVPALALHTDTNWWHTVASYLFVFARDDGGSAQPLLPVGWTLNYEMFFYAVMAAVLFWRKPLVPWTAAAMLLTAAASAFVPPALTPLTVCHPIVLEFVAGMGIAALALRGVRLGTVAAAGLAVLALAMMAATDALDPATVERGRLLYWGVPGALLLFAAVTLEPWIAARNWRLLRLIGDASYALYLSHGFVLPVCAILLLRLGLDGIGGAAFAFVLAIAASVAVGIATHLWIERPMTDRLSRWRFRAREPLAGPAPSQP